MVKATTVKDATFELLRRVWTLYVVHIFVFVLFVAQVSFTAAHFGNALYFEEMNMTNFLEEPHVAVMQALILRFQPPQKPAPWTARSVSVDVLSI